MNDLFLHPVFKEAIADIESLGVRVSSEASSNSKPYAVVGGRSNARWWLIPLENGRLTASGLALFQPLLTSARYMKAAASILSAIGLSRLWVKYKVFISGESSLARHFHPAESLSYAYFTGTSSPHRKVAVQIMDSSGTIKGFAKVSRNPRVHKLLNHEAGILIRLGMLNLQTINIPKLLYIGEQNDGALLITDTLKTPLTKTKTSLMPGHITALKELAERTIESNDGYFIQVLKQRYVHVSEKLTSKWQRRFENGLRYLEAANHGFLPSTLTHGDFTPWNTFFTGKKLYVFDWEYAETDYPCSNDLIHFLLATPGFRKKTPIIQIRLLCKHIENNYEISLDKAIAHLIIYLLSHTLRYVERLDNDLNRIESWEGEAENAELMETIQGNYL